MIVRTIFVIKDKINNWNNALSNICITSLSLRNEIIPHSAFPYFKLHYTCNLKKANKSNGYF